MSLTTVSELYLCSSHSPLLRSCVGNVAKLARRYEAVPFPWCWTGHLQVMMSEFLIVAMCVLLGYALNMITKLKRSCFLTIYDRLTTLLTDLLRDIDLTLAAVVIFFHHSENHHHRYYHPLMWWSCMLLLLCLALESFTIHFMLTLLSMPCQMYTHITVQFIIKLWHIVYSSRFCVS